jgi:AraC-like DNA-binding protein
MAKSSTLRNFRVQFLSIHFFKSPSRYVSTRRSGEPAEVIVMLGGVYRARIVDKDSSKLLEARSGDIVYWPTGAERVEENDPQQPIRCVALYFEWRNPPEGLPFAVRDHEGIVRILAERLLSLRDYPLPLPPAVSNAYLSAILAEYVRLVGLIEDGLVAQVARYTEEHMSEPFALKALASYVGLERHHFGRKYKTLTGQSPMQHVRRRRAEHALGLLMLRPKRSLKDVASRVGIGDEHHLRRLLRVLFGFSIRELRRMKSGSSDKRRKAHPALSPTV